MDVGSAAGCSESGAGSCSCTSGFVVESVDSIGVSFSSLASSAGTGGGSTFGFGLFTIG